ncbi:hypothetical protein HOLleu_06660 [Holothuria leucospilota]|uniref:Uncharacterized protein n=1 Tax=Holothuria leucospilota TaxID=206669 RepID=A0A9Q1CMT3_HOLLE|nr:hypothetical protein HOLleu_06660 [Holothuria leucospilota]
MSDTKLGLGSRQGLASGRIMVSGVILDMVRIKFRIRIFCILNIQSTEPYPSSYQENFLPNHPPR